MRARKSVVNAPVEQEKKPSPTRQAGGTSHDSAEAFFLHFFAQLHLTATAMDAFGVAGYSLTKHRILGFATLTPGMRVGDLVRTLRVSHQNLNEPLRRLIDEGYILAKIGVDDRRHKQLFATPKGSRLYLRVLAAQQEKFEDAFRAAGPEATKGFLEVQRHLVEAEDHTWVRSALQTLTQGGGE